MDSICKKTGYFAVLCRGARAGMRSCGRIVARFCEFLIYYGRPLLGPRVCRFQLLAYRTCTDYALYQLKNRSFFTACGNIIYRLLCCNPLYTPPLTYRDD